MASKKNESPSMPHSTGHNLPPVPPPPPGWKPIRPLPTAPTAQVPEPPTPTGPPVGQPPAVSRSNDLSAADVVSQVPTTLDPLTPLATPRRSVAPAPGRSDLPVPQTPQESYGPPSAPVPQSVEVPAAPVKRRVQVDDEPEEKTVLAVRRRQPVSIVLPDGSRIPLKADTVIIGRKLDPSAWETDVQLINVKDATRTVSKTHARLSRETEGWIIEDLDSTNGIFLVADDGSEAELDGGGRLSGTFILGDLEFSLETTA